MDYLIARYHLDARLSLTVHDEIRYLVKSEDRYKVAMALQVANLWTRAMFSQQMGINDLPQSCAFFSAVDIDHVLRKEVDMDCVTPSHPQKIPHGESLDIWGLIAKGEEAALNPEVVPKTDTELEKWHYTPRIPVMAQLTEDSANDFALLRAQITGNEKELREIIKEVSSKNTTASANNHGDNKKLKSSPHNRKVELGNGTFAAALPQEPYLPAVDPWSEYGKRVERKKPWIRGPKQFEAVNKSWTMGRQRTQNVVP
ncbi:MAG: hypothetical protein Q9187_009096 [Circinaria calcarea]